MVWLGIVVTVAVGGSWLCAPPERLPTEPDPTTPPEAPRATAPAPPPAMPIDSAAPRPAPAVVLPPSVAVASHGAEKAPAATSTEDDPLTMRLKARAARHTGAFATARDLLCAAAERSAASDPDLALALREQASDLDLLLELAAVLAAQPNLELSLRAGGHVRAGELRGGGHTGATLDDVVVGDLASALDGIEAPPAAWLGVALLAGDGEDTALAERALVRVWTDAEALRPRVDALLQRVRGDPSDALPYRLVDGRLLSAREIARAAAASEVQAQLEDVLQRGDAAARAHFLAATQAAGAPSRAALVEALGEAQLELAARIGRDPFRRRVVEPLLARHNELAQQRAELLALVNDTTRYAHPAGAVVAGSPPAVAYEQTQRDVDERIAALRTVWRRQDPAPVPAELEAAVERFAWVSQSLVDLGEARSSVTSEVEWALVLPAAGDVDLSSIAADHDEAAALELARRVVAFDDALASDLDEGEATMLLEINDYRRMLGLMPLAISPALCRAAREHSHDMVELGFFGHESPRPGHHTAADRAAAVDYRGAVLENCTIASTAASAFHALLRSAPHHRNLVAAWVREIGIGDDGNHWTIVLGGGQGFLRDPRLPR